MKTAEEIKLEWQKHNRDHGMSWNEIAELVNEVAAILPKVGVKDGQKLEQSSAQERFDKAIEYWDETLKDKDYGDTVGAIRIAAGLKEADKQEGGEG